MVTSKGRILFTAYEFTGSDKNSVAIYSMMAVRRGKEESLYLDGVQKADCN